MEEIARLVDGGGAVNDRWAGGIRERITGDEAGRNRERGQRIAWMLHVHTTAHAAPAWLIEIVQRSPEPKTNRLPQSAAALAFPRRFFIQFLQTNLDERRREVKAYLHGAVT